MTGTIVGARGPHHVRRIRPAREAHAYVLGHVGIFRRWKGCGSRLGDTCRGWPRARTRAWYGPVCADFVSMPREPLIIPRIGLWSMAPSERGPVRSNRPGRIIFFPQHDPCHVFLSRQDQPAGAGPDLWPNATLHMHAPNNLQFFANLKYQRSITTLATVFLMA